MNGLQSSTATTSSTVGRIQGWERPTHKSAQWSDVILLGDLSQWQVQGIKNLVEVVSLPDNWDSYGSRPPAQTAVTSAIQLIMGINLDYFLSPRVVPVSGGGVQLEWSFGAREVEIEIDDDGSVEYLKTERGRPIEEGQIALTDLAGIRSLLMWLMA